MSRPPPKSTLFPYTTLFRSGQVPQVRASRRVRHLLRHPPVHDGEEDVELVRSEEHTSELQSLRHLVCRLLLEKKNGELLNSNAVPGMIVVSPAVGSASRRIG